MRWARERVSATARWGVLPVADCQVAELGLGGPRLLGCRGGEGACRCSRSGRTALSGRRGRDRDAGGV